MTTLKKKARTAAAKKRVRTPNTIDRTLKLFARLVMHGHGTLTVTFSPGQASPILQLAPSPGADREPGERFLKVADVAILEGLSASQVRAKAAAKTYDVDDDVGAFVDPSGHWRIPERGVTQRDLRNSTRRPARAATPRRPRKRAKNNSVKKREASSAPAFRDKMSSWRQ